MRRIDPGVVERIASEATREGSVVGVRHAEVDDAEPWVRPPSGHARRVRVTDPLPRQVHAVLAQRLFVEKAGLPSAMIDQIKRLAAFQNPEFYKRQRMRLSSARVTSREQARGDEQSSEAILPALDLTTKPRRS